MPSSVPRISPIFSYLRQVPPHLLRIIGFLYYAQILVFRFMF